MGKVKDIMVEIPEYEYKELQDALDFLQCLEAAGVEEWIGYDDAVDMYEMDLD